MDDEFRLHHVGVLVPDVANACESFVRRFGYVVESRIIEDQQQTAFVCFLRLPGADHWTELVAPNGPKSVLIPSLKARRGGIHHVCYEVADIERACTHLHGLSMTLIAKPVAGVAFGGRRIAWCVDRDHLLVELVEAGIGPLSLPTQRS